MSLRRGACPTLAAPMPTGDGLLARMNPVSGGVTPETLSSIAVAAERFGNGLIEVTARGSLQIRGLTLESAPRLAAVVDEMEIAVRSGVPVETGPLAGLDPEEVADARPLAVEIRGKIAAAGLSQRVGPKVSVIVDGGGRLRLDAILADIRLQAVAAGGAGLWRVSTGGTAETARELGLVSDADAATAVVAILETLAAKGRTARAREVSVEALSSALPPSVLPDISLSRGEIGRPHEQSQTAAGKAQLSKLPISPLEGEMSGRTEGGNVERSPLTLFRLRDTRVALGIALPFGQATAAQMGGLAEAAGLNGVRDMRFAPGRILLALAPTAEAASALKEAASALGFITDPADPRLAVVACAGAPACASGHLAAREIASEIARDAATLGAGGVIHVSGCAKLCAKPAHAVFTLVGTAAGTELYCGDATSGEPVVRVANDAAAAAFRRAGKLHRQEKNTSDKSTGSR